MKLFAIDPGNRQVKLMSEKGTKVLPSYYVDAEEYGDRNVLAFAKGESKTSDYTTDRDRGYTYVWGEGLNSGAKVVTDTMRSDGRYNTREFGVLVDFALAELARDFKEAKDGMLDVVVVTGVPTEDYDKPEVIKQLISAIKGVHSATIDGVSHVVKVHDVYVLMQPVGTAIDIMVDETGDVKDGVDIEDSLVGIVDCGGGTVLIESFDSMNLDKKNRMQMFEGAYTLYGDIRSKVTKKFSSITDNEVERLLRECSKTEEYIWSPNGRETYNLTNIVMEERNRYTRKVASTVNAAYKANKRMKTVYVTGGTANLLVRTEFELAVPKAKFVEESETANVRGFYKYGLANEVLENGDVTTS